LAVPNWFKRAVRAVLALTPYQIVRGATNRFDAIEHSQVMLARFGYAPRVIIDAGAHVGLFAEMASRTFPGAVVHMIEPQPACHRFLKALPHVLHPVALGASDGTVRMSIEGEATTGAHVWETGDVEVPMARLDSLFTLTPADRAFLKMDLQGYELEALKGAEASLASIEVILTEVNFFAQAFEPPIATLVSFLDERGFDLFDIASLGGRARDDRLKSGDFIFVRRGSPVSADTRWA
jgi:FkbM family methyltransferase